MNLQICYLNQTCYEATYSAMQNFTHTRDSTTPDQIWITEHFPVFTQGLAGKAEHILSAHDIPVIQSDRGGQVTYHGPGQLLFYVLIDLKRKGIGIHDLVNALEKATSALLHAYHISAITKTNSRGVYVGTSKIASIGLRIKRGCSYHGLSLNVDMDLTPFEWINPCGFPQLKMAQMRDFMQSISLSTVTARLIEYFASEMQYAHISENPQLNG